MGVWRPGQAARPEIPARDRKHLKIASDRSRVDESDLLTSCC